MANAARSFFAGHFRLTVTEPTPAGGVQVREVHPAWGDPFLEQWKAFYHAATTGEPPKTTPADARQDLELFGEMIRLMRQGV